MDENEQRVADGTQFVELLWWTLAKRIIGIAGDLYKWDTDAWERAQEIFLRSNDYQVKAS